MRCRFEQPSAVGVIEQPRAGVAVGRAPVGPVATIAAARCEVHRDIRCRNDYRRRLVLLRNCGTLTWPSPAQCEPGTRRSCHDVVVTSKSLVRSLTVVAARGGRPNARY